MDERNANLIKRARDTHTLSTQTSCFPFDYKGPGQYVYRYVGFLLCTIFSALSSVAFNLQKLSINENDLSNDPKPVYLQWKWVLGLVFLVTGSLVDFVAYGLAPQSLLTPLAALVLVWNILVAKCGKTISPCKLNIQIQTYYSLIISNCIFGFLQQSLQRNF